MAKFIHVERKKVKAASKKLMTLINKAAPRLRPKSSERYVEKVRVSGTAVQIPLSGLQGFEHIK